MASSLSSSSTCYAKGVILGVFGTLAAIHVVVPKIRDALSNNRRRRRQREKSEDAVTKSSSSAVAPLMDAPDLPLRLLSKAEGVLQYRSNLLIVIERCVNDFNYSAILRTAEALGVQDVWLVDPPPQPVVVAVASTTTTTETEDEEEVGEEEEEEHTNNGDRENSSTRKKKKKTVRSSSLLTPQEVEHRKEHHLFAQKATAWLSLREFSTSSDCWQALKKEGYQVWATDLSQEAVPLTRGCMPLPEEIIHNNNNSKNDPSCSSLDKIALVFGTEAVGVSQEMLENADLRVYLPLRGFADSLNLSVATALVIQQVFMLYPQLIGNYPSKEVLRELWYTQLASQRMETPKQKKAVRKLRSQIADCESYQQKLNRGGALTREQTAKLARLPDYRSQLSSLEAEHVQKSRAAVEPFLQHNNAAPPLTDLRRADLHRICYVGRNTKRRHAQDWKGMVATSNGNSIHMVTSSLFRSATATTTSSNNDSDTNGNSSSTS